jgi:SOS response associated peptidase (SRAP)
MGNRPTIRAPSPIYRREGSFALSSELNFKHAFRSLANADYLHGLHGLARMLSNGYMSIMCGRVIQSSGPLRYTIVDGMGVRDSRVHNYPPRWNGAPSQELLVIRRNHKTGEVSLDPLCWGLIPYWCQDPTGGRKPINAKCETVHSLPTFRDAFRNRRCILPADGFFEWKAIKGPSSPSPSP